MTEDWFRNAVLASGRAHNNMGADFGWFGSKIAHAVASVVRAPVNLMGKGVSGLGSQISKIPVVGKPLHSAYAISTSPVHFASQIASGQRIDRAVYTHLKEQAHN